MAFITSRKHATNTPKQKISVQMSSALAVMLLPLAAQTALAADVATSPAATKNESSTQGLKEINVSGDRSKKGVNEFKADKAASVKYTEALVDTPQTITVIKRELIEQQGAVTLTEALRNTPGVGTFFLGENGSTSTGDAVYMRGFDTSGSIYVDGVRDLGSISRDMFNIEQIDVLKGPAGTDSGRGSPTGSINLSSKQPTLEDAFYSLVTAGSGSNKRVTADWNKVINAETGTAFRVNLMDQDSGNPARDEVKNKRWAIAPSLAFGLNGATRVNLNYLHVKQDNLPDGGVPTIGLPGYTSPDPKRPFITNAPKVDSKNFYGAMTDFNKVTADMATVRVEHDFSSTSKLQNTSRYGKNSQNYLLTSYRTHSEGLLTPSATDLSTWTMARTIPTVKDQVNEIFANQTTLTAQFTTGVIAHSVVSGLEFINEKQTNFFYKGKGILPNSNLYHPDPSAPVSDFNLQRNGERTDGSTSTQSAYVFDTLKLGEQWQFNLGLRADHYSTTYTSISELTGKGIPPGTMSALAIDTSGTLINGKLAALYKPTADSSVYAMVATSKQPPGGNSFALSAQAGSAANPKFDPQETITKEIGTKWDFLQQKLAFTAALYQTEVKNEVEQDPLDLTYRQTGKKRVQGLELGVTGEIVRGWLISAGYAHMDTSVEAGSVVTASGVNNLNYTPKQTFTAWTSYTLPMGLMIGGGARYVDQLTRGKDGAVGTPVNTEAYWVFDAMASYRVSKNLDLQLNLYNLADKEYVASINKSGYRYTPGAPRSFSVTANIAF
ncbi:catecholate siderophore receptor Fiu [Undibacterium parvum]|uniref:Catecholate siderophore receptor Fiu n=1 Tax=Undibacterium parvum TaxID=401471 RepID=A0A3Q9BRU5_9BURK|nr:catecholate siderophore receptor Fiu [Undibacterium parvum]AZP13062.1 catecholate siderophore receptor Fiu [Undibacterium parvum]MCX7220617.1 catecholate siderophore receptor Fiu [Burkholderiales bacterium]